MRRCECGEQRMLAIDSTIRRINSDSLHLISRASIGDPTRQSGATYCSIIIGDTSGGQELASCDTSARVLVALLEGVVRCCG